MRKGVVIKRNQPREMKACVRCGHVQVIRLWGGRIRWQCTGCGLIQKLDPDGSQVLKPVKKALKTGEDTHEMQGHKV
jgi:ribosomal protein L37AE/L43A